MRDSEDQRGVLVAVCQSALRIGAPVANLQRVCATGQRAPERGARLVVAPEPATAGYVLTHAGECGSAAKPFVGIFSSALIIIVTQKEIGDAVSLQPESPHEPSRTQHRKAAQHTTAR